MTAHDQARALVALPWWRWMEGMRGLCESEGDAWRVYSHRADGRPLRLIGWRGGTMATDGDPGLRPNLLDPATVGCLHALAEEVVGMKVDIVHLSGAVCASPRSTSGLTKSGRRAPKVLGGSGDTKGEAIADLLLQWEGRHG